MKKNLLTSILFLVLSFLMAITFAGCDCKGCNNAEGTNTSKLDIYFSSDEIKLTVDDSRRLDVFVEGVMQNPADITFASENPNVVLINDEGEVTGFAPGSAYVTASFQDSTTKCLVNVDLMGLAPEIVFDNADYDKYEQIAIPLGDELDMSAKISFNGKIFDDAKFEFDLSDKSLGSVSGTKFESTKSIGELEIYVSATWRGVAVKEKTIKVVLTNSLSMTVNGEPFHTINTTAVVIDKKGAITSNVFDFDVVIKDKLSDEPIPINVVLENHYKDVIYYDWLNHSITVNSMGTAYIDVYQRRADGSNGAFLRNIKIVVNPYIFEEKSDEIYLFDVEDGLFDVESIFGDANIKVSGAEFIDRDVKIEANDDGAILGIKSDGKIEPTAEYVNVYNKLYGYKIQIKAYGKIVDSPEDLLWFNFSTDGKDYDSSTMNVRTLSGYYIMTKDIDMSEVDYSSIPSMNVTTSKNESNSGKIATVGFRGVFDGQGHSIYNMKGTVGGIFGVLNGTLKNVAFKNVSLEKVTKDKTELCVSLLSSRIFNGAVIENVYINVPTVTSTNYGVLSKAVSEDIVVSNLVVILNTDEITKHCSPISSRVVRNTSSGGFSKGSNNPYRKMQNVILVTSIPLGTEATSNTNVYTMDTANATNLELNVSWRKEALKYTTIENATVVRFDNLEQLSQNKNAISGILDKFKENKNWLVKEEGKVFWGNGESLYVNGDEGVKEIDLYFDNDFGFRTELELEYVKNSVDFTSEAEITTDVEGIVLIEGNVIKANANGIKGDVVVTVSADHSSQTFIIHVKEALDSAKVYVNLKGNKADAEYAGEVIKLYYKEGEDISATHDTFFELVVNIEGKDIEEKISITIEEGGAEATIVGNKISANGEGEFTVLVDCGRGKTFEIAVKTYLIFFSDDLTGSGDFPADWLSGQGI